MVLYKFTIIMYALKHLKYVGVPSVIALVHYFISQKKRSIPQAIRKDNPTHHKYLSMSKINEPLLTVKLDKLGMLSGRTGHMSGHHTRLVQHFDKFLRHKLTQY